ncbi:MAG: hypothetical protein KBB77_00845 [Candidatus Moranbacteria bacterium]|nr:hypothetical protein [Candidatus Moranbacteria bacterium]
MACCSKRFFLGIQIVLLTLIAVGFGLLMTQDLWVPKVVDYIIAHE